MLICIAPVAWGQVTVPDEYGKQIQHRSDIGVLNDGLAGDQIDLSTGRLDIVQTDIDLSGNNALAVRVARRFQPADGYNAGHFGTWTLELPNIRGTFMRVQSGHWPVEGSMPFNRCSGFGPPPMVMYQYAYWDFSEHWHGDTLHLPGVGDRELLLGTGAHAPTDGHAYPVGTKEGDAMRCVPLAATSVSGSQGEGFEVVTSTGVVYTLNQMVVADQSGLKKLTYGPRPSFTGRGPGRSPAPAPQMAATPVLPREDVILFPTRAADRFGNTVTYNWSSSNPWQLLSIVASDGRRLDFTYVSSSSNQVASITDGVRIWRYTYDFNGAGEDLLTVTQPDGSAWRFSQLSTLFRISLSPINSYCGGLDGSTGRTSYSSGSGGTVSGSITAPSGATVTFNLDRMLLGRSKAIYECLSDTTDPGDAYDRYPYLFLTAAVVKKTITGPNLPASGLIWSYAYGPTNNCWDGL